MYSRFSPEFIEASLNSQFRPGEHIPCPRCGHAEVVYGNPRRYLFIAAVLAAASVVALVFRQVSLALGSFLAAGILALTIVCLEPTYSCGYCGHTWRFRDAEKWARAIRHDHAAKA